MLNSIFDLTQIIIADIILSGDNALIIGMAAASLAPELRKKAILFGMIAAALLRVLFAALATILLDVPGLLFIGGLLLFYVCWGLYKDIREKDKAAIAKAQHMSDHPDTNYSLPQRKTLMSALITITIADVSMSLDNVLAVAAIADGNVQKLIFGLGLAILLMAFAATLIMKLLSKYPWISWFGLAILVYVSGEMLYRGIFDPVSGIGPMPNLFAGTA